MGFNSFKATWERTDHLKVSGPEMSVLYALAYIMNDKTGACFPSHQQIAKKAKLSRTTVKTALCGLRRKGLVKWTRRSATSNRYTLTFLQTGESSPTRRNSGSRHPMSDLDMRTIDAIATELAKLCGAGSNFAYNLNTYRKLIRERDLQSCEELLHTMDAEIRQNEHLKARNIGAIITMRLKELPVNVINSPSGTTPAMGRQPPTGGTIAAHGGGQMPSVR